ncbi:MAG: ABC transporter permease [Clostridiales bacterium]|jgi:ABC-2 type transport system permease protein|nr:ABC transporter permease [Clostridiales bacterium]
MKNNITGWRDVYSFTLAQVLKSKAYRITFILLVLMVLVSMPITGKLLFNNSEDENALSPVNKVYVNNTTSYTDIDFKDLESTISFSHIEFEPMNKDYDSLVDHIIEEENSSVILNISEENGAFSLHLSMSKEGQIKRAHLQRLGDALLSSFTNMRMESIGVSDEQLLLLQTPVVSKVTMTDINGEEIVDENTSISFSEYWFVYGILFFVMMTTMLTGTQVATSIVTEKSTRVVEYLLITVKPLALMIGKVFAMLTAAMIQMLSMVAALFVSNKISAAYAPEKETMLSQLLPSDLFANINLTNMLLCIVLVFLGIVFYAVLAGLAGATVSRLEVLNEGLTLFTMTSLVGVYIGLGAANTLMGSGTNAFVVFAFLFPLSSPFVLPGAILVGKASLPLIGIAIVLQLAFIMILFRFVARVYETLILHSGNTIKLKELFKISKSI